MPSAQVQRALTDEFMRITHAQERIALRFLKSYGWKLDQATEAYYAMASATPPDTKSRDNLGKLFEQFRSKTDEADKMGIDGMMEWLQALEVNLEDASIMIPLEIVQAPALGEITKDGFVNGWLSVNADTIDKQKDVIVQRVKSLSTDRDLFKRVYRHTFISQKEKAQKAIPLANAIVYWQMLFAPPGIELVSGGINFLNLWINFLESKWTKSVNKDMWNQTYEFFNKALSDPTLSFWSEDGAWPGVIDEFVEFSKGKISGAGAMETD